MMPVPRYFDAFIFTGVDTAAICLFDAADARPCCQSSIREVLPFGAAGGARSEALRPVPAARAVTRASRGLSARRRATPPRYAYRISQTPPPYFPLPDAYRLDAMLICSDTLLFR
jgi:hypothetical protein